MLTLDEPRHTQYRSLVSRLFTASRVNQGAPTVRRVIDAAVERLAAAPDAHGEAGADFVAEFALPVPLRIIADRLGIPQENRKFFDEAAAAAADALRLTPLTHEQMVHRAQLAVDLQNLLVTLFDARRGTTADDMIGILANSALEGEDRIHHCIGAPLARQELNLGFAALLDAFDGFRLADGADPEAEPSFILRNLPRLRVRYRRRAPGACAVEVSRQRNFQRDRQVAQAREGVAEPPGR